MIGIWSSSKLFLSLNPCWRNCWAHLQIRSIFFSSFKWSAPNILQPLFCSLCHFLLKILFCFFIFEKYIWPLFAYLLQHNWIALFKFQLQQKQKLPKSVGISCGWSSFLREYTISKIANLVQAVSGLLPTSAPFHVNRFFQQPKKHSGRIENTKKRTFKVYFNFDFSGIIFIFFQMMRVNAKVTFGTFHRESFGILQGRQPGFRQNAFLSDKRGAPTKCLTETF